MCDKTGDDHLKAKKEFCCACGSATGFSGRSEDSIYIDTEGDECCGLVGPLCKDCFDSLKLFFANQD